MMNGGGWCIGGRVVMMMPEIIVAEFPCGRFRRKPPPNTQAIARQGQPDEHEVKINAVILRSGRPER